MSDTKEDNPINYALEILIEQGVGVLDQGMAILVNDAMKIERSKVLQAGAYERTLDRAGRANGYKAKRVKRRLGNLELRIPQVRYADDFIIMVKSQPAGARVFKSIRKFLERELKLEVNETKSKVAHLNECAFLGFQIIRGKIRWSEASERAFKRRIKELTGSLEAKWKDNLRSK